MALSPQVGLERGRALSSPAELVHRPLMGVRRISWTSRTSCFSGAITGDRVFWRRVHHCGQHRTSSRNSKFQHGPVWFLYKKFLFEGFTGISLILNLPLILSSVHHLTQGWSDPHCCGHPGLSFAIWVGLHQVCDGFLRDWGSWFRGACHCEQTFCCRQGFFLMGSRVMCRICVITFYKEPFHRRCGCASRWGRQCQRSGGRDPADSPRIFCGDEDHHLHSKQGTLPNPNFIIILDHLFCDFWTVKCYCFQTGNYLFKTLDCVVLTNKDLPFQVFSLSFLF